MVVREFINLIGFKVNQQQLKNTERSVQRVADKMQSIGTKMTLAITTPFVAMSAFALKAASDANEIQSAFNQVFGDLSAEANMFAETFANSLDRADTSFKDALTSLQSFTVGMGLTREKAFEASKEILQLGLDLSSFRNVPFEEVMGRFRSALSGSSEAVDQFGINLKAAAIESKAAELGIKGSVNQMGEMHKVLIRLAIIRDTMGRQGAIGDAVRTNREFANRLRSASEQVKKLGITIGKILLPPAEKLLNIFINITKRISSIPPAFIKIVLGIGAAAAVVGPLAIAFSLLASVLTTTGLVLTALSAPIIAIIGWIGLLADDLITFVRGGRSLIGTFLPPWEVLSKRIGVFFSSTTKLFKKFKDSLKDIRAAIDLITVGIRFGHEDMVELGTKNLRESIGNSLTLLIDFVIHLLRMLIPKIFELLTEFNDKFGDVGNKIGEAIALGILDGIGAILKAGLGKIGSFLLPEAASIIERREKGQKTEFKKPDDLLSGIFNFENSRRLGLLKNDASKDSTTLNTTINNEIVVPAGTTEQQKTDIKKQVDTLIGNSVKQLQLIGASTNNG